MGHMGWGHGTHVWDGHMEWGHGAVEWGHVKLGNGAHGTETCEMGWDWDGVHGMSP